MLVKSRKQFGARKSLYTVAGVQDPHSAGHVYQQRGRGLVARRHIRVVGNQALGTCVASDGDALSSGARGASMKPMKQHATATALEFEASGRTHPSEDCLVLCWSF